MPVVAECDDGWLNTSRHVQVDEADVRAALASAVGPEAGPTPGGALGAGTGMICHELKGGIGTASRRVEPIDRRASWATPERRRASAAGPTYTVGVLALTNYGRIERLTIDGVRVGEVLVAEGWPEAGSRRDRERGELYRGRRDRRTVARPRARAAGPARRPGSRADRVHRRPRLGRHLPGLLDPASGSSAAAARRCGPPSWSTTSTWTPSSARSWTRPRQPCSIPCSAPTRSRGATGTWCRDSRWIARSNSWPPPDGCPDERGLGPARPPLGEGGGARRRLGRASARVHDHRPGAGDPSPVRRVRARFGRPAAGRDDRRPLAGERSARARRRDHAAVCDGAARVRPRPPAARPRRGLRSVDLGLEAALLRESDRRAVAEAEATRLAAPPSSGSMPNGRSASKRWPCLARRASRGSGPPSTSRTRTSRSTRLPH